MLTFNLSLSSRETRSVNGVEVYNSGNRLAVPNFLGNVVINAGLGAAWTTASHWVGASVLTSAGHTGYAIRGQQYVSPALIGLAAGPAYQGCKALLLRVAPTETDVAPSCPERVLRTAAATVLDNGYAALVGVLVALAAQQRGDTAYPGIGQGAAISVTGNAIMGAAMFGVAAIIAGCAIFCGGHAVRHGDIEMSRISR